MHGMKSMNPNSVSVLVILLAIEVTWPVCHVWRPEYARPRPPPDRSLSLLYASETRVKSAPAYQRVFLACTF